MATTTSVAKGNTTRRGRAKSLRGLIHAIAQLQEAIHNVDQIHGGADTELSKHLVVMNTLLSHMTGRRRNLSCILMLHKDEEPARLSDLFRVIQDVSSWIRTSVPGALLQLTVAYAQVTDCTFAPQNNKLDSPEYTLLEMLSPIARLQEIHKLPMCTEARTTLPNVVLHYSCVKFVGYETVKAEKEEGEELCLKVFSYYANTESKDFPGNCCVK